MRTLVLSTLALACGCNARQLGASGSPDAATGADATAADAAGADAAADAPTSGGGPLRLIAPLSTSTVTQQRPTLHWTGATTSPQVDLCLDRGCTQPLAVGVDLAPTGTSATVAAALPPGWIYWRVRDGAQTTATWQFWVGRASASTSVDTSSGTMLDINGDGYGDFVVGGQSLEAAYVYLGSANGTMTAIELVDPKGAYTFGNFVSNVGDLNGDGYGDFWVNNYLYLGGPNVDASSWNGATAPNRIDSFTSMSPPTPLGDVNGDGYGDLLFTIANTTYVYFGQPTLAPGTRIQLVSPDGVGSGAPIFGWASAAAGDVNGDGYADFIVSAVAGSESDDMIAFAHLYLGGPNPSAADWNAATSPHRIDLPGLDSAFPYAGYYGDAVSSAGDLNGDGYSDFVVGAFYASTDTVGYGGIAHLYLGSPTPATADWTSTTHTQRIDLAGPAQMNELGWAITPVGDVDGDGYTDLLVGEVDNQDVSQYGGARLYLGDPDPSVTIWNGDAPSKRVDLITPEGAYGRFGWSVAAAGDTDGDGYADFVIGACGEVPGGGAAYFYRGEAAPDVMDWNGMAPSLRGEMVNPLTVGMFGNLQ